MSKIKNMGFTLIEMLVVISIIALLAGLMVTGINAARERAKRGRAQAEVAELTRAWSAYWKTYNKWPEAFGYTDKDGHKEYNDQPMNATAMSILQGTVGIDNKQGLKFSGIATDGDFLDPWGSVYVVDFEKTKTQGKDHYETTVYFPNRKRYEYGYE